jgi:ABC-type branched-subunit amino acid transport system substrate-binding protein
VASLAIVTTGCGDDSSSDGSTTTLQSTTTAAAATGDPVRIMLIGSLGGLGLDFSQQEVGARAAVEAINRDGGVGGAPIELEVCNDNFMQPDAEACARQAVDEGFAAVVGGFSVFSDAYVPILAEAGVPVIGGFSSGFDMSTEAILNSPNSFPLVGGFPILILAGGTYVAQEELSPVSLVIRDAEPVRQAVEDLVTSGLEGGGGGEVAGVVLMPLGAPDASPTVAAALDHDPSSIGVFTATGDAAKFVQNLRQGGSEVPVVTASTTLTPDVLAALGAAADGVVFTSAFEIPTSDSPGVARFLEEMADVSEDAVADDLSQNAWASVYAFASVAGSLSEITPAAVMEGFAAADRVDVMIAPPIDFTTPAGDVPRLFNAQVMFGVVEDGQGRAVTGDFVDPL